MGGLIGQLTEDGVEEVHSTKGTGDDRVNILPVEVNFGVTADMRENFGLSQFDQTQLGVVGMGGVVLQAMETSSKKAQGFMQIFLISGPSIFTPQLD